MQSGVKVRRKVTVEQDARIRELVFLGYGAAQIHRQMAHEGLLNEQGNPSEKTIQRMVKDYTPEDPSGPWSFTDTADADEPALVFDVLLHMNRVSHGRVWLSKDIAKLVARLRRAWPDIPPSWAYVMAQMYQERRARGGNLTTLDLITAIAPWRCTGPPSSWDLFAPQSTLRGRSRHQIRDFEMFIVFLTRLAEHYDHMPVPDPDALERTPEEVAELYHPEDREGILAELREREAMSR
jgi:hypothetical protein